LFGLLQSLQFVDDGRLVFESSGAIALVVDAEGDGTVTSETYGYYKAAPIVCSVAVAYLGE